MTYDTLLLDSQGSVARLTLNRPDRLNAFTRQMLREILLALEEVRAAASCRALLIKGAGRSFCAGQDLSEAGVMDAPDRAEQLRRSLLDDYHPVIQRLRGFELPVVAAVQGAAAGAGCSFALACDFVIAAESAQFTQSFARLGLIPDCGGSFHLPRLVGEARARCLTMLAEPLAGHDAAAWGLIHAAVTDDRLDEEATALAGRLAAGPTKTYALIKQAIAASANHDLDRQLALEADLQEQAAKSDDFTEGLSAFLEKRQARFSGA